MEGVLVGLTGWNWRPDQEMLAMAHNVGRETPVKIRTERCGASEDVSETGCDQLGHDGNSME